jgi:putative ABC transport system permease protein
MNRTYWLLPGDTVYRSRVGDSMDGFIPISNTQLLLTVILVIITGLISALLRLGLLKSLLWGTVRAFVQLTLIGYVLNYVFAWNTLWIIIPILVLYQQAPLGSSYSHPRSPFEPHFSALSTQNTTQDPQQS